MKVDPVRWKKDEDYRRATLREARARAKELYGIITIVLDDSAKTVMATIDAQFWTLPPSWVTSTNYAVPKPR